MEQPNLKMDNQVQLKSDSNPLFTAIGNILNDGFSNSRMKIGQADQNMIFSKWTFERTFLDWMLWTTLYTQSWVFRNAIDKKSDSTVADIEIESDAEPTEINNVIAYYDKLKSDLKHLLKQAALYGGAASALLIEGQMFDTESELDVRKIKKGSKMSLFTRDRWQGLQWEETAGYEALGTSDFGKHKFYKFQITGDTGQNIETLKFHHSRVLRCGNRPAPQFVKYQLTGWDLPEGQHMIDELTRDETTRASIASLVAKALIEVVKMPGIRGLFSGISGDLGAINSQNQTELESRIKAVVDYRNFNNLSFLDKEDEYQQFQLTAITGLADILQQQRRATSGATEIPEMILYGSSDTKGLIFQSDGTHAPEIEIYQQTLTNRSEYILRPILDKLLPVIWRIANGTDMPEGTTYQFLPIFKESQTIRLERAGIVINNVEKSINLGIMSPKDGAEELRQHAKQTGFGTNLTDDKIAKLSEEIVNISQASIEVKKNEDPIKKDEKNSKSHHNPNEDTKLRKQHEDNKVNKPSGYKFERRGGKR
jgi:uncharacterized protein